MNDLCMRARADAATSATSLYNREAGYELGDTCSVCMGDELCVCDSSRSESELFVLYAWLFTEAEVVA